MFAFSWTWPMTPRKIELEMMEMMKLIKPVVLS